MIESYPESVEARTKVDGFLPLEMACQSSSLDVIYTLVKASIDQVESLRSVAHGKVVERDVPVPVRGKRKRKRTDHFVP